MKQVKIVPVGPGSPHLVAVKTMFHLFADMVQSRSGGDPRRDFSPNIRQEAESLPGIYGPPSGRLFVALENDEPAGCQGLRKLGKPDEDSEDAELKRLYVMESHRRHGLSAPLVKAAIDEAKSMGYRNVWIESINSFMTQTFSTFGFCSAPLNEVVEAFGKLHGKDVMIAYTANPFPADHFMVYRLG